MLEVLDPGSEHVPPQPDLPARPTSLAGATVGLVSNGKEGTRGFFRHLAEGLRRDFGVAEVVVRVKSNYSAPADAHIRDEMGQWDFAISGIGD